MKPPPQLLVLLLLWIQDVVLEDCIGLPKRNIHLSPLKKLRDVEPHSSYIGYISDKMYFLRCYLTIKPRPKRPKDDDYYVYNKRKYQYKEKHIQNAVITSSNGKHVVTIVGFDCSDKEKVLTKRSYMFFDKDSSLGDKKTVLALGIKPDRSAEWCRYDICISCRVPSPFRISRNYNSNPDVDFIQWSEKGIPILKKPNQGHGWEIVAEYVSIGNSKFVLSCYSYGEAVVRSTMGKHIVYVPKQVCSPHSFIQTFYVFTMKKGNKAYPAVVNSYQLGDDIKGDDSKWYKDSQDEDSSERMFYFFLARSPSKMCYWKKVNAEVPNSCPSLPDDAMTSLEYYYYHTRSKSEAIKMYRNLVTTTISLICFKTIENKEVKYLSKITDSKGNHIVTITNMDCSSKENFDRMFFIHTPSGNTDMRFYVVGRRWSVSDDWCTYSVYKLNFYKNKNWVYYDFNPVDDVSKWEEVDLHQCPVLNRRNIAAEFTEPPREDLTSTELWTSLLSKVSLLMYCYTSGNEENTQTQYVNVIKTVYGEALTSIIGLDCLSHQDKDVFYIAKEKMGEKNYLIIGTRTSPEYEWCHYDFCVDCEKKEVKRNFSFTRLTTANKRFPVEDSCLEMKRENILTKEQDSLKDKTATSTYWNGGNPRFTMRCYREPRSYAVITSADKHVLTIKDFDCSNKENIVQKLYIHTLSGSDDISNIVVGSRKERSGEWCFYNVARNVEKNNVWVHYGYQPEELIQQWYKEDSCPVVPKKNIIIGNKSNGNYQDIGSLVQTYVSINYMKFKILHCYSFETSYTSVIKSAKGIHEVTVKGLDCSKLSGFDIFYMKNREKSYLILWTYKYDNWCRYDICLNCDEPEIQFNIDPTTNLPTHTLQWTVAKQSITEYRRFRGNKEISTTNINVNQERHALVAKFVTNYGLKFQLHCYKDLQLASDYFAVVTDANGKNIIKISNHDCSLKDNHPHDKLDLITYNRFGDEIIILVTYNDPNRESYYTICWNCETSFVMFKDYYLPYQSQAWKKVPLDDCPSLKREDIYIKENKYQLDENKLVTRYITNGAEEKGMFMLSCYSIDDTDTKKLVSVLRNQEGSHLVSIKGLDCSSKEKLDSLSYISVKKFENEEVVYLGTRPVERIPWCQFDVCISCKTAVTFNYDLIPSKDFLEWSEAGINMSRELCPSPKVEANFLKSKTREEYTEDKFKTFWLDCYKPDFKSEFYLKLRTSKGLHIVTITTSRDCTINNNLIIKQFFVIKNTNKQQYLFKMDQPDIEALIESCWNFKSTEDVKDIWFYYFLTKNKEQNIWKIRKEKDKTCRRIKKGNITTSIYISQKEKVEYWNGRNKRIMLSCYQGTVPNRDSRFAKVTISGTGQVFKIDDFDCLDGTQLYDKLYIDTYDSNLVIVGSRDNWSDWCWYGIYLQGDSIEHAWIFDGYIRNPIVAQWYKVGSIGCPAVKSENIITDKNKESLDKKGFNALYIEEVYDNGESARFGLWDKKDQFYNYCYYENDDKGKGIYVLVIRSMEGHHLATIRDYDCSLESPTSLEKKAYMFTMTHPGYPDYLAFGTRASTKDGWCQYDICLNCETKEVRTNQNTLSRGTKKIVWEKTDLESCKGVRSEYIFTNENEKNPIDKKSQSVLLMEVINIGRDWVSASFTTKEAFLTYCYFEEGAEGKSRLVIRTVEGRHLATIGEFDCSPQSPLGLPEKTYMFTLTYSGHYYLALGTRTSSEDNWCRYDICLNCKTKTVGKNLNTVKYEEILFRWKTLVQVKNHLSPKDTSKEVVVHQEKRYNTLKPIAKYKSGEIVLDCYQSSSSSNYKYTSVILDRHGNKVADIQEHDCSSVNELRKKLTVFISKNIDKEDDLGFLLIDLISTSLPYNYKCCNYKIPSWKCTVCVSELTTSVTEKYILKNEWIKVPTETCYSIPRENILTVSSEVNLSGYKVLARYINEDHKDEDSFLLICYQNDDLNEGEKMIAHLKTIDNKHVVSIKNLDCSSHDTMSRISYMSIMTAKENRYLVLGSRSARGEENGPWCRYDICISCSKKDIRVNATDDPGTMKTLKWSMAGLELTAPNKWLNCGGKGISSDTVVSRYANTKDLEFSVECHVLSDHQPEEYCSVFKKRETPLAAIATTNCMVKGGLVRNFYLYTLYKDSELSLLRVGQTKDIQDYSVDKKIIQEQWLYYFLKEKNTRSKDWIQVKNPKTFSIDSIDLEKSKEKEICLPKNKKWFDLEPVYAVKKEPARKP